MSTVFPNNDMIKDYRDNDIMRTGFLTLIYTAVEDSVFSVDSIDFKKVEINASHDTGSLLISIHDNIEIITTSNDGIILSKRFIEISSTWFHEITENITHSKEILRKYTA